MEIMVGVRVNAFTLNSIRNELLLRGGEPLRGRCVANPILKFPTSGMNELTTTTTTQLRVLFRMVRRV